MENIYLFISIFLVISFILQNIIMVILFIIVKKNNSKKELNEQPKNINTDEKINLSLYIKNSNDLVDLINHLIIEEVSATFWKLNSLGKPYEAINMDSDIKKVSQKVYGMIRNEIIDCNQTIYSSDALMTMIINKSMNIFIQMASQSQ